MNDMFPIRVEQPEDGESIRAVHVSAFASDSEAMLVERLRLAGRSTISLVALWQGAIAGHILFSPVTIDPPCLAKGLGLAPLAVLPGCQAQGIGSQLVQSGLESCRRAGFAFVVVLGWSGFYRRFGFRRASLHRLSNEYAADENFMVVELVAGSLPPQGGLVRYAPEFKA